MIPQFATSQNTVMHPLSSRNVLKGVKPTTSVFQISTKNTFHVQDSSREFGKDITNVNLLTVSTQNENVNTMNNAKQSESALEKKLKNLSKQKEDLTQKLKYYDIKVQTLRQQPIIRSQTIRIGGGGVGNQKSGNNRKGYGYKEGGEEFSDNISMRYNNIINNDIMTGDCLGKYSNQQEAIEENVNDGGDAQMRMNMSMDDEEMNPINDTNANCTVDVDVKATSFPEVEYNSEPQTCKDYIKDIHTHLRNTEHHDLPKYNYMSIQTDINEKMRSILIDWLIEVHLKYKLVPETMFLTVNLIDRYLEQKPTMRNKLQLVGVSAMFIACKYEEIFAPEVGDFVYITDNAYKKAEVIKMESDILQTVRYNVTVPSSYRFLELYKNYLKVDQTIFYFAWYLLELALIDIKMLKYCPSLLAASACMISLKMMKMYSDMDIDKLTGYSEEQMKECSRDICALLQNTEKASLQAIRKKFSLPKYMEVSKIKYF